MSSPLLEHEVVTSLEARDKAFYLGGREVALYSGAMHYFRVVPEYWADRMRRMKACGLNTLETYVPWNLHEEVRGEFNFDGRLDLRRFLQTAQEVGLHVLLRPGPYICSEWDFGGLPSWLLSDPDMEVRSSYQPYLDAVDRYFSKLHPLVTDLQHSQGGPIIAVQLENEYGSYGDDLEYKMFLKRIVEKYGISELLFTSDNGMGIRRGDTPGVLVTANFQEKAHGYLMYEYLRHVRQPDKPLMVMEFWTGWFDHWGGKHEIWPIDKFEEVLRWLLDQKSSINFYMMHGGTNFGFMNGANQDLGATNAADKQPYAPDVTSYDYDAPIAENGDITEKGHKIRELLTTIAMSYMPDTLPELPDNIASQAYGEVKVTGHVTLEDMLTFIEPIKTEKTVAMEMLNINNGGGQGYGYIMYRNTISGKTKVTLTGTVKDRAQLLINGAEIDVVDWSSSDHVTELPSSPDGSTLDILVENLGRVNYADYRSPLMNQQRKGLTDPVLLDGEELRDWTIYPLEFKETFINRVRSDTDRWREGQPSGRHPSMSRLNLHVSGAPTDTYINMKGWTRGIVIVNGFNLGRYWNIGPQESLYLPGPLLNEGDNQLLVFELHEAGGGVSLEAVPSLGETVIHKTVIPEVAGM